MSAIPYPLDPLGTYSPYFEVVVKPGVLSSGLTFGILNGTEKGYLKVVDWGDGTSSETAKREVLTHTYSQAGTYTVRIKQMTPILLSEHRQNMHRWYTIQMPIGVRWGT